MSDITNRHDGKSQGPQHPVSLVRRSCSTATTERDLLPKNVRVIGMTPDGSGAERKVVVSINSHGRNRAFYLSCADLAIGNWKCLAAALAETGYFDYLDGKMLKQIAQGILKKAAEDNCIVLCTQGLHKIEIDGETYSVYVWGCEAYSFGPAAPIKIVVANINLPRLPSCDLETWIKHVASKCVGNPYLIVTHAHALSAAIRRAFDQPRTSICLVGPSGTGKSSTQQSAQSQSGHVDAVKSMSGTKVGLVEFLLVRPDSPVFFQDIRQNDSPDIFISLVFDVAEGAGRMRSGGEQRSELATTMILSNERLALDMVRGKKTQLDEGLYSRLFEIECSAKYGAFHDLHGCNFPDEFAKELQRNSRKYFGAAWPVWIRRLSKNWPKILRFYENEFPKVHAEVAALAGEAAHDRVNNRILEALSFSAWVGLLASKFEILPIARAEIVDAFSLVLREHISRQVSGSTPLAEQLISEVRGCLDESTSRFVDLSLFNDKKHSAVYGYRYNSLRHGELFLFLPNVFARLFQGTYGSVSYKILADAGFLVTTHGRGHQYQVRVPGLDERKSFIAVTANLRFD